MQITKKKNLLLNVSPCVLKPAWHTCFTVFNPWQLVVTPGRLWLKTTFQTTHRSCTEPCWLSLWRLKAPISTSRQFKPWKKIVQMGQSSQLNKNIYISLLCLFWCLMFWHFFKWRNITDKEKQLKPIIIWSERRSEWE